ncbi:MAG: hypothetical protein ACLRZ9_05975 [Eubacterium sp.]
MKVYELIQQLVEFDAETEVVFNVEGTFSGDCDCNVDLKGEEAQTLECEIDVDEYVEFDEIRNKELHSKEIIINLTY